MSVRARACVAQLAERYAIKTDDFPQFRLFLKGTASTGSPLSYSGDKKSDAFLRYVQVPRAAAHAYHPTPGTHRAHIAAAAHARMHSTPGTQPRFTRSKWK